MFHISIKTKEKICIYGKCEEIEVLRRLGQVIKKAPTIVVKTLEQINWTGLENFGICSFVLLSATAKVELMEGRLDTGLSLPTQIQHFPIIS